MATFSVVLSGNVSADLPIAFAPATACPGSCGSGKCNEATFQCECPDGQLGRNCQTAVVFVEADQPSMNISVEGFGTTYVTFKKPVDLVGNFTMRLDPESEDFYWQAYVIENAYPPAMPRDYEGMWIAFVNTTYPLMEPFELVYEGLEQGEKLTSVLLKNNCPVQRLFLASADSAPNPTPAPNPSSSGLSGGAIAGIVIGSIVVVIVVVVVVFMLTRGKKVPLGKEPLVDEAASGSQVLM
jgi:hypothetical protein